MPAIQRTSHTIEYEVYSGAWCWYHHMGSCFLYIVSTDYVSPKSWTTAGSEITMCFCRKPLKLLYNSFNWGGSIKGNFYSNLVCAYTFTFFWFFFTKCFPNTRTDARMYDHFVVFSVLFFKTRIFTLHKQMTFSCSHYFPFSFGSEMFTKPKLKTGLLGSPGLSVCKIAGRRHDL